jgi:predicted HTH transcriptional regulator
MLIADKAGKKHDRYVELEVRIHIFRDRMIFVNYLTLMSGVHFYPW